MRTYKTLEKAIESKCLSVITSPDSKNHVETITVAKNIMADMKGRKDSSLNISVVRKNIAANKKRIKGYTKTLLELTIEGNHMLESIKPTPEIDTKNLKLKTKLEKLNDTKFLEECMITNSNLVKHKQKLLEHGYTEAQINPLSLALAQMNTYIEELSNFNLTYSEIRKQQNNIDSTILENFNKLNMSIEINKVLMPNLFHDYFAIKLVTAKKQPHGILATITCNGNPVANASVKLFAYVAPVTRKKNAANASTATPVKKEKQKYDKLTNSKGEVKFNNLKPETYLLVISKNGYVEQRITVYINPKEISVLNIELKPL